MRCQKCNSSRLHSQKLGTIDNFQWCLDCGFQGYSLYQEIREEVVSGKGNEKRTKTGKISTLTV